jgi:hypothetical protein
LQNTLVFGFFGYVGSQWVAYFASLSKDALKAL